MSWTISSARVQPIGRRRATASIVRPHETAIVPARALAGASRSTATSATASRATSSAACPGVAAGTSATTAASRPNRLDERVLQLHEPGVGMDDLDPDDRLLDRAVQQPPDLEPAEPDALADLRLAQVQPVVELRDPHHQADVARGSVSRSDRQHALVPPKVHI